MVYIFLIRWVASHNGVLLFFWPFFSVRSLGVQRIIYGQVYEYMAVVLCLQTALLELTIHYFGFIFACAFKLAMASAALTVVPFYTAVPPSPLPFLCRTLMLVL